MAKRLEPYRDYSEHDVVNLFSLDTNGETLTDWKQGGAGNNDDGVVVYVKAGSLPGDTPAHDSSASAGDLRDYLGAEHAGAHIGYSSYPYNDMIVAPCSGQAPALGITLRETLAYDENGEKMLYYPQKLDEANAVLPGKSVPVLTQGTVLLKEGAFVSNPSLGDPLKVCDFGSSEVGKLMTQTDEDGDTIGHVIATGVNSDDGTKSKFLCRLSFGGGGKQV